jgi:hypothetical protein
MAKQEVGKVQDQVQVQGKEKEHGQGEAEPKKEIKEVEILNLDSFVALQSIVWQTKSRLEQYLSVNKLSSERTLIEWQALRDLL